MAGGDDRKLSYIVSLVLIVVVPMILLFIFCRKSIVTGVSRGGLKG